MTGICSVLAVLRCLGLWVATVAAAGCSGSTTPKAPEIIVFAAISVSEPIQVLAARFEKHRGASVRLNLAGSNTLATQALNGAPVDVFLSADNAQMDRLADAGLIDEGSRSRLLSNRLVVITPAEHALRVGVPGDLAGPTIGRFAIGDPAAVPAGRYAAAYLQARGVWPRLQARLVYFPHVRAVTAAVEKGAADAGIVYRTDARVAKGTRLVLEIDEDPRWAIAYPIAVLRSAPHGELARAWVAFLQQPDSLKVFGDAGFIVAGPEQTH